MICYQKGIKLLRQIVKTLLNFSNKKKCVYIKNKRSRLKICNIHKVFKVRKGNSSILLYDVLFFEYNN